jgi:aminoglycoside phosphotransferase (APT) family kinase protein
MFDPNENREACEKYLSRFLGGVVKFVSASQLPQSTRQAPWKLDVTLDGIARPFVMQLDPRGMEYEYRVLKAMEAAGVPSPRAYGLDLAGEALGVPCFFSDFIAGESLLKPMIDGEPWAEALYFDTVCTLHSVTESDLGDLEVDSESAAEILEAAWEYFKANPHPLADVMYKRLKETQPDLPPVRFSNGDLWLDNFIVQDQKLAGVIDFQNAAFSDPIFEFLLSFFVEPKLQGRGIEERFCRRLGYDPAILHWYHGLEFFDTWRAVLKYNEPFVHHTAESLEANIKAWLLS